MPTYLTPGVSIEEVPNSFSPILQQDMSTPAFIGYTEFSQSSSNESLKFIPTKITSLSEYEQFFGGPYTLTEIEVVIEVNSSQINLSHQQNNQLNFIFYYAIKSYFINGGKDCYVVSIGNYNEPMILSDFVNGLTAVEQTEEISLLIYPESVHLDDFTQYYQLIELSLQQCENLRDRFLIFDCLMTDSPMNDADTLNSSLNQNSSTLRYGAAYYPYIIMEFHLSVLPENVEVNVDGRVMSLSDLSQTDQILVQLVENYILNIPVVIPSSASVAGKYVKTDLERGIWKAPAGENIVLANKTSITLSNSQLQYLTVDPQGGSSINSIKEIAQRGPAVVWGARTLDTIEWKYIPLSRTCMMIEASIKKGIHQFIFDPNDVELWAKLRVVVTSFLTTLWRNGALLGSTDDQAFFVRVGLGSSMSQTDIENNLVILEIGVALSRPAEFTILKIVQNQSV